MRAPSAAVLVFLLSGCLSLNVQANDFVDVRAGSLEVAVVDDALSALSDARVEISRVGLIGQTGRDGTVIFLHVPAGLYLITVGHVNHLKHVTPVEVRAEERSHVIAFLEPLPSATPYFATRLGAAYLGCYFAVRGVVQGALSCGDANHRNDVKDRFEPTWAQYIAEADWRPTGLSTNPEFALQLKGMEQAAGGISSVHIFADVAGPPPIKIVLLPETTHTDLRGQAATPSPEDGGPVIASLWKEPAAVAGQGLLGAGAGQGFELYFTTFFLGANPDARSFSARPDR